LIPTIEAELAAVAKPVEFGRSKLNLNGLTSQGAEFLSNATAGQEREDWRAATRWLLTNEFVHSQVRSLIGRAASSEAAGEHEKALELLDQAIAACTAFNEDSAIFVLRHALLCQCEARLAMSCALEGEKNIKPR
jgi:hypothetical protein